MDEQQQVDRIIDDLYAGSMDTVSWNRGMGGITNLLHCSGGFLLGADPTTQKISRAEIYVGDPAIMQDYLEHWAGVDMRIPAGFSVPVGVPDVEQPLEREAVWRKSAILNDFLLPADIPYILPTWLHKSSHRIAALTFQGSKVRGRFDDRDRQILRRLIPHVQRSLAIRDRLETLEIRARTLSEVARQAHTGLIVLDVKGRILDATGEADKILKEESGLRQCSDRTLWMRDPAGSQLREWIANALPPKKSRTGFLRVCRRNNSDLQVVLTPMPTEPDPWISGSPRWLLFVFDCAKTVVPAAAMLSQDLGISAREAEIAAFLSTGRRLPEVAERLGISIHTLRVHLKHIFEKTETRTQSDLVRRVLLSPAMRFSGNP